jgi:hypothetical protein
LKLLEATPGIEPGYTVLQATQGHFPKTLMLTRFFRRREVVTAFQAFLVALNGFSRHSAACRGTLAAFQHVDVWLTQKPEKCPRK